MEHRIDPILKHTISFWRLPVTDMILLKHP